MNCINCKFELPAKAKFCLECGAKQNILCECGEVLPPTAKFCMECGTSVAVPVVKEISNESEQVQGQLTLQEIADTQEKAEKSTIITKQELPETIVEEIPETTKKSKPAPMPKPKLPAKTLPSISENGTPLKFFNIEETTLKDYTGSARTVCIPNGIKTIGKNAFINANTSEFKFSSSVRVIEDGAFHNCNNIKEIVLPDSVRTLGDSSSKCKGVFSNCNKLQKVVLSKNITKIPPNLFTLCEKLSEVVIPEKVTEIGFLAFASCPALKEINIPQSVTTIDFSAFSLCLQLKKIDLPKNIETISHNTFESCDSLTELNIPEKVTTIKSMAFCDIKSIKKIVIPKNVINLAGNVFFGWTAEQTIYLPNHLIQTRLDGCDAVVLPVEKL